MTRRLAIVIAGILLVAPGCYISRRIADVKPPPQPNLEELEEHLTYVDPDDGRDSFVIEGRQ